jgi:hypothetical protein
VELFYNSDSSGQGQTFADSFTVTTNVLGVATISRSILRLPAGWTVTATATAPNGNTSALSLPVYVV